MNIRQMETDLRAKQAEAKTLLEATMRAAAADKSEANPNGRAMTDAERAAVQAKLDDAKALHARIEAAKNDASFGSAIDALTAGMGPNRPEPDPVATPSGPRSIGSQFVSDEGYRRFIAAGGHRRSGSWTSPSVDAVGGLDLRAATLTTDPASGGALVQPQIIPGVLPLLFRRLVVADLIAPGTTDSNSIKYIKETTFTNAAAPVAQGAVKPESTLIFAPATATVEKLAHWIPVTDEMLEDYAQTQSIIDARLQLGLGLTEEDQLLNGGGVSPALLGFNNLPGLAPDHPRGTDTNMDAIFRQMTALATTSFIVSDGIVLNPANWMTVQLAKNANGNYLGSGPWAPAQGPTLWGVPVAVTPAQLLGTGLVGAFRTAAQLFRKGGVRVEASNSHADFFVRNLVAIRAEERLALAVYREAAFGQVTGLQ